MKFLFPLLAIAAVLSPPRSFAQEISFIDPPGGVLKAPEGHVHVEWKAPEDLKVVLERSSNPAFRDARIIYSGTDKSTFLSGLRNGEHYLRLRSNGEVSERTLRVIVDYPSDLTVLLSMAGGSLLFLILAGIIVKGQRRYAGY